MPTVSGEVVLPAELRPGTAARVHIEVRDVSFADAPAPVLAAAELEGVRLQPNGRIPFLIDVPEPEPGHDLGLRVHIDRAGDGTTAPGDLINTTAVHVAGPLAPTTPSPVVVPVAQI